MEDNKNSGYEIDDIKDVIKAVEKSYARYLTNPDKYIIKYKHDLFDLKIMLKAHREIGNITDLEEQEILDKYWRF